MKARGKHTARGGFRRSAVLAFFRFGAILIGLYAIITAVLLAVLEDRLLARRLTVEIEELEARLAAAGTATVAQPPRTRYLNGYIGIEQVPLELRPWVEAQAPGIYEIGEDPWFGSPLYLAAIRDLPEGRGRLFLFYDVRRLDETGEWVSSVGWIFGSGAVVVGLLGLWMGRRLAGDLVEPVVHLAETVATGPPETLSSRLEPDRYPGEVRQLADALRQALERVAAFVRREQRFTRNASHELRTPVTVARGAAELLSARLPPEDAKAQRQLDRIQRAVGRMEETIEAFLWLSREQDTGERSSCRPAALLADVVDQHRHRLGERPVAVELEIEGEPLLDAPEPVVSMAIGNLVANAFDHTLEGRVTLLLRDRSLEIVDTGSGIPAEVAGRATEPFVSGRPTTGFGLGLTIVGEICERFGWHLSLESEPGGGTCATIDFGEVDSRS